MNGAESLVRTLVDGGVEVCFANPGTSEMHFVAALDRVDGMRCVLGLFEGVVTGAADGYARMADKPAATLLHLGPGLANGLANLHNAVKSSTPMVNIVGDHASYHRAYDAPLTSDIETAAKPFSGWVRTSPDALSVAVDGAAAIAAARTPPGRVATLILPADTAWNESAGPAVVPPVPGRAVVSGDTIDHAARILRSGEPTLILLTGPALRERGLELAGRIATATGARLMAQTFNARIERGAGRVPIDRVPYLVDLAVAALAGFRHVILVGSKQPVAFFAYPDKPSVLTAPDAQMHVLARPEEDLVGALEALADALGAGRHAAPVAGLALPTPVTGTITPEALSLSIAALLPENAIVIDEAVSTGRAFFPPTRQARPHTWLQNMGGSIGLGLPMGTGAALAAPDRKTVCLQADGSAMYTLQALWTMARESLDVTIVLFANRSYAILLGELANVGAQNVGRKALDMLDIGRPDLDWVSLARGMGVPGVRVTDMAAFNRAFAEGLATPGPYLVEAVL
ncbi:MAG TPA: acetolactate synthase large subunit [Aliidongia sp.]|uniref:acetolactate synthase large subunit n=1 Tax=Aliidongia sp. TaxID=1914230 RepID=UPI002DDDA7EF|nr:acetolactate synthase large subunit [Aliidongia sp.]HEV2675066.1 acetolactate synthase large subunit [Aliidongia sp.]